jgi:uncharacterized repeat protein (TIGR01451 family)/CSLREA domain-containing protein
MSRTMLRRALLVFPLTLATLAGCTEHESIAPLPGSNALRAQGDGGVWTVNTLADPGDGTCDDANCTLREAIAAAASGNQIVFASALQGDIKLDPFTLFIEKSLSVNGGGRIGVDAQGLYLILQIGGDNPTTVTLDGLTLKNGGATTGAGGGVRIGGTGGATVTIKNSTISGTSGFPDDGGGIFIESGSEVTLVNSVVTENAAGGNGGGIWNDGKLSLINSIVTKNQTAISGGGVWNGGTLFIQNSTVSRNTAVTGGGIANLDFLSMANSTVNANEASTGTGGGIYLHTSGNATIVLSTISNNAASKGAGIESAGTLELRSTTITRNIHTTATPPFIGGVSVAAGTATMANSIIAGNTGAQCSVPFAGTFTSLGHNLTTTPTGLCAFTSEGDVHVTSDQVFSEVLEMNLFENGGPTRTHALIARGRAVDVGYCPGETADQRGFARPVDDPTRPNVKDGCDIGAYEAQGPVAVVADLMVSQTVDKASVKQGELLTYTVRVQNLGPQTAPNVVVNDALSSGVTFVEARVNKGTVTAPPNGETGTVTWYLGDMADQANEVAEIKVTVLVRGKTTVTSTATVTGDVADPNTANNSAAITVSVVSGKAAVPRKP